MLELEKDIKTMIDLSYNIGKLEEQFLISSNIYDKLNYNRERCILLKNKLKVNNEHLNKLKSKWFE